MPLSLFPRLARDDAEPVIVAEPPPPSSFPTNDKLKVDPERPVTGTTDTYQKDQREKSAESSEKRPGLSTEGGSRYRSGHPSKYSHRSHRSHRSHHSGHPIIPNPTQPLFGSHNSHSSRSQASPQVLRAPLDIDAASIQTATTDSTSTSSSQLRSRSGSESNSNNNSSVSPPPSAIQIGPEEPILDIPQVLIIQGLAEARPGVWITLLEILQTRQVRWEEMSESDNNDPSGVDHDDAEHDQGDNPPQARMRRYAQSLPDETCFICVRPRFTHRASERNWKRYQRALRRSQQQALQQEQNANQPNHYHQLQTRDKDGQVTYVPNSNAPLPPPGPTDDLEVIHGKTHDPYGHLPRWLLDKFALSCFADRYTLESDCLDWLSSDQIQRLNRPATSLPEDQVDNEPAITPETIVTLRRLSEKTHMHPPLRFHISDLISSTLHHPRLDCILTSTSISDIKTFIRISRVLFRTFSWRQELLDLDIKGREYDQRKKLQQALEREEWFATTEDVKRVWVNLTRHRVRWRDNRDRLLFSCDGTACTEGEENKTKRISPGKRDAKLEKILNDVLIVLD